MSAAWGEVTVDCCKIQDLNENVVRGKLFSSPPRPRVVTT